MPVWNPLVPDTNRIDSPNANSRGSAVITHIVIHVTGTNDFNSVRNTFTAKNSTSAHYLVHKDGQLFQFIPDAGRAYHAGIDTVTRALYRKGRETWQRCLKYFDWYKGYPADAVYVDVDLKPVRSKSEAIFVMRADGKSWPEYDYFNARWSGANAPVNFEVDADPNRYSIGIELLGVGAKTADPKAYTSEMYGTLDTLLADLSLRYHVPRVKGRVVGHEDVNPVTRFGWDPSAGFDWSRVYKP